VSHEYDDGTLAAERANASADSGPVTATVATMILAVAAAMAEEREACLAGIEALYCADDACNHAGCSSLDEAAAVIRGRRTPAEAAAADLRQRPQPRHTLGERCTERHPCAMCRGKK